MSGKNQTTIAKEFVDFFGLRPGTKLMQSREGNRLIIEPVGDVMTAFGAFKPTQELKNLSIAEEKAAAEQIAVDGSMNGMGNE
jgi:bifunctional DNA-binding transcriptional regulator/antitoxin component of YhaV-PrlF toxin-antitoxin module